MMDRSTYAGPLDDHGKAQHLTELQMTLQALAGTGLFTKNDAAQHYTQIARLVHINLAAQCSMHYDVHTVTESIASNLGEDQSLSIEDANEEASGGKREASPPDDNGNLVKHRKRDMIKNLNRIFSR